jgi:hypothetical protein
MFKYLLISTLIFIFYSCAPIKIIQKSYPKEKLFISNFVFDSWNSAGWGYGYEKDTVIYSPDSIMQIFLHSLTQLDLPIILDDKIEQQFKYENFRKLNKIDTNKIKSLAVQQTDIISIIPVISLRYSFETYNYIYYSYLQCMIFLVKNGEIIYINHDICNLKNIEAKEYSFEERPIHTQKDWDELVRKVMQPYIDRLK